MTEKKQYKLVGNELTLTVKKAPLFVRSVMFLFAFLFFLMPLVGMLLGLSMGKGLHIGYFIGIFFFSVMGFFMLRNALWNTYGKELIIFDENRVRYVADYGWFKDGKKEKEFTGQIEYGIRQLGYEDDNKGGLIIGLKEPSINCVTKMPNSELEELIDLL
jgi:hypothetical protein